MFNGSKMIVRPMRSKFHACATFLVAFLLASGTQARFRNRDEQPAYVEDDVAQARWRKQPDEQPVYVAEEVMQTFQQRQGIKAGYELPLQYIEPETNSVTLPDGTVVSLDGLEPKSLYTSTAECYQDNLIVPCSEPTVFSKTDKRGNRVMVSKDANGDIMNIIVGKEGSGQSIRLEAVAPGIVTYIPQEAFDEDFYKQFVLADPLTSSIGDQVRQRLYDEGIIEEEEEEDLNEMDIDEQKVTGRNKDGTTTTRRRKRIRPFQDSCDDDFRTIEVAIASESSFCDAIGKDNVEATVNSIMAAVALEYEIDGLCFTTKISYRESYCDESSDPYKVAVDKDNGNQLLQFFAKFWNVQRANVDRDVAELFSGSPLGSVPCFGDPDAECEAVGIALGIGQSCAFKGLLSYGINHVTFSDNAEARSNLVAHEIGHTVGAEHDDSSADLIMYPVTGPEDKYFGDNSIDSFLVLRNEKCIT